MLPLADWFVTKKPACHHIKKPLHSSSALPCVSTISVTIVVTIATSIIVTMNIIIASQSAISIKMTQLFYPNKS